MLLFVLTGAVPIYANVLQAEVVVAYCSPPLTASQQYNPAAASHSSPQRPMGQPQCPTSAPPLHVCIRSPNPHSMQAAGNGTDSVQPFTGSSLGSTDGASTSTVGVHTGTKSNSAVVSGLSHVSVAWACMAGQWHAGNAAAGGSRASLVVAWGNDLEVLTWSAKSGVCISCMIIHIYAYVYMIIWVESPRHILQQTLIGICVGSRGC